MHHHLGARLGASAGPLSLLLLPKCPLCLVPLLTFVGLVVPASVGMWIVAGVLVGTWMVVLLVIARHRPAILAGAAFAGLITLAAAGIQSRSLLWIGVLAMTSAGLALSRSCAHRVRNLA